MLCKRSLISEQVIICEGKHANISCTEGRFIAIRLANYGRFTITQCNPTFNTELSTTCQNDKTLGILQLECNGKSECDFEVSNEYFGDACPKTSKYLDMQYDCTLTAVAAPTTKGSIMDENGLPDASVRELPNGDDLSDARDSDINGNDATYHAHAISVPNDLDSKSSEQHLTAHCEAISSRYIDWPKTEVGKLARMGCPIGSSGYAEWKCELDGKWNKRGADLSRCVSSWSLRISEDAELAEDIVDRIETLREIQQMTRKEELLGGDLIVLSKAINQSIPLNFDDSANADLSMELVVESVNNMAKTSQESAWNDLSIMKSRRVISSLMDNINKIACAVSVLTTSDTTRTIIKPNIEVQISNVKIHEYVTFPSMSLYKKNLDTIDVPKEALSLRNTVNVYAKVVYSMYSAMASHMKPLLLLPNGNRTNNPELNQKLNKNSVNNNGGNDNNNNNAVIIDRLIVSNIISASIINKNNRIQSISRLSKPVVLTFKTKLSDGHLVALTFITYSGCTLSILCLLLSFIAFSCIASQSGTDRLIIHANLSLSLLCAECIFLFGIWQTQNKIQCGIIAALLHYLFLCAFSWMLLEGFELYYMLIEVFQSRRSKKHYFYLFGYGCPALVVSIALWMDPYSYGTERYCWLRADNYFIVSSWLRGSIALVFLLGLTWTFGLLWIDERSTVMAYAFTILNSLQGLFIFLFHVVFNDRWAKRRASSLPDCIREQTSTSATSSNLQRSSPYTRTQQQALNSNSSNTAVTSELLRQTRVVSGKAAEYSPLMASIRAGFSYDPRGKGSLVVD
ncbi:unnamed protein product [Anisakis simplex]|uniref:Latrophilin-like protein 1 (inferred by orthology to a C. elegans protein) n=1 Tax=Anisakis simplex TaxID=6269 RepID=A0A0M3JRC1_ANISI|nr:unnamed protein product [Anisakis simplex]